MVDVKVMNSHNKKTRHLVLERAKSQGCKIPTTAQAAQAHCVSLINNTCSFMLRNLKWL